MTGLPSTTHAIHGGTFVAYNCPDLDGWRVLCERAVTMNDAAPYLPRNIQRQWWTSTVERALTSSFEGASCQKCRLPREDRRRPRRHHRDCPLRGAGRWKRLINLIDTALWLRTVGWEGIDWPVLGWTLHRVLALKAVGPLPAKLTERVDEALDRFTPMMPYPPALPLPRLVIAAVDTERVGWGWRVQNRKGHLFRLSNGLDVFDVSVMTSSTPYPGPLLIPMVPRGAKFVPYGDRSMDRVELRPSLVRCADTGQEVVVYTEGEQSAEVIEDAAERAERLMRLRRWPGPREMAARMMGLWDLLEHV